MPNDYKLTIDEKFMDLLKQNFPEEYEKKRLTFMYQMNLIVGTRAKELATPIKKSGMPSKFNKYSFITSIRFEDENLMKYMKDLIKSASFDISERFPTVIIPKNLKSIEFQKQGFKIKNMQITIDFMPETDAKPLTFLYKQCFCVSDSECTCGA